MSRRRVAITGLGLITPCGKGWKPYWQSVLEGRSHIRYVSHFSLNGFPAKVAGEIPHFDPSEFVKQRKFLKVMSREIQLAVAASHFAIEDAHLPLDQMDRTRFGISLGTGIINNDLDEIGVGIKNGIGENGKFQMTKFGQEGIRSLYPLWFLKYLPNMPACHISIAHGLSGPSNTITTSSAAGAQAIGEAFHVIQRGDADLMLCGSTDSKINAMGLSRFNLLGLLSYQNHIPEKAYRPFDERHDGIIIGEGAGFLVLEGWNHALERGAKIYGELCGYGSSSDFNYDPIATEDFNGKRLAMTRALNDAGSDLGDIDFLLANGSGIPQEDAQETQAVHSVFNHSVKNLNVTALKAVTGHLIYGSAGVEIAAGVLALDQGVIPPAANLEKPAPECDLPFVKGQPKVAGIKTVLFNSFGFGGQNASLIIRKGNS